MIVNILYHAGERVSIFFLNEHDWIISMIQSTKHALILDTAFLSIVLSKMLKKCHQYNVYKLNEIY